MPSQFPIVDVDATYYAHASPGGERLPASVKELLPAAIAEKSRIYLRDVQEEAEKLIWEMQAQALAPLAAGGKLGCMPFSFRPGLRLRAHIDYLKQLRDRGDWPIAVEDQQLPGGDTQSPWRSWASHMSSSMNRRASDHRRRRSWHQLVGSPWSGAVLHRCTAPGAI